MMLPDRQSKTMVSRFSAAVIEQRLSIAERANPMTSTLSESRGASGHKKSQNVNVSPLPEKFLSPRQFLLAATP
jgi:hypothetical protein